MCGSTQQRNSIRFTLAAGGILACTVLGSAQATVRDGVQKASKQTLEVANLDRSRILRLAEEAMGM
ncbi:MAG: hypothetical protein ABFE01_01900, partial [Phycisphaerales bacterium]